MSEQAERPPTMVEQVLSVQNRLADLRENASNARAAREYSIAITAAEDLIMRINRGKAHDADVFAVGDFESLQLQFPDPDPEHP